MISSHRRTSIIQILNFGKQGRNLLFTRCPRPQLARSSWTIFFMYLILFPPVISLRSLLSLSLRGERNDAHIRWIAPVFRQQIGIGKISLIAIRPNPEQGSVTFGHLYQSYTVIAYGSNITLGFGLWNPLFSYNSYGRTILLFWRSPIYCSFNPTFLKFRICLVISFFKCLLTCVLTQYYMFVCAKFEQSLAEA
jgi:hypothetical protein